ncbi:MAG: DNA translocase FtsK [Candidatus Liptonbacteria bacterium]|nr:DNA translocase FtsK [Candidatus Liptonbacteria bacterium]
MAKKNKKRRDEEEDEGGWLKSATKRSIWGIALIGLGLILVLARGHKAGPVGELIFKLLNTLLGWGYLILPASIILAGGAMILTSKKRPSWLVFSGAALLLLSSLGLIQIFAPEKGGWLGFALGSLKTPFGQIAATVINLSFLIISVLITLNIAIKITLPKRKEKITAVEPTSEEEPEEAEAEEESEEAEETQEKTQKEESSLKKGITALFSTPPKAKKITPRKIKDYISPPLDLLKSSSEKPTTGDLRANANIIKRTLESFGIPVDMGEINIGPKVTRYTLKPAEGVKLSRITALSQDLALALATHPIRIEAPIPGKSLVGIEVPNKAAALVRLGSLIGYQDFQTAGPLGFALGRNVSGEPIFASIDKMPHLLVAGATGSGKSIMIHSILISLLYKNSPSTLKMILIDPKRVELSVYDGLPHLATPVITQNKKAINALRWAISEMDRRYDLLLKASKRDIKSYNETNPEEPIPYLLIVVDELADLMTSYGRELEGSIVRLAQMARATGIHLILSTQRPSVEIITGLIKANITSRIALQVASQIDSRTILDTSGAEKLLGGGDLLFISSELSKPKRIQGAYLTEEEVNKVVDFIKENNEFEASEEEEIDLENGSNGNGKQDVLEGFGGESETDDELYLEAVQVVSEAEKASASLLQRRLKVGYARAARLLDLMEENGLIGPGDGAKPREVFSDKIGADFPSKFNEDQL